MFLTPSEARAIKSALKVKAKKPKARGKRNSARRASARTVRRAQFRILAIWTLILLAVLIAGPYIVKLLAGV